jgi:hypothetical protein
MENFNKPDEPEIIPDKDKEKDKYDIAIINNILEDIKKKEKEEKEDKKKDKNPPIN